MIGKNKKVTFIRIPKNASTSLYNFFGPTNTIRDNVIPSNKEIYKNFFASSHCRISDSVEHLGDEILSLPTLSVVRNPYDRMVSMYFFAQKLNASYKDILSKVFSQYEPQVVFHAAAYKHVNILEKNVYSAVKNNVLATFNMCDLAIKNSCEMIFISTDKAANPTSILGYTKRSAEKICEFFNQKFQNKKQIKIVRFGNVFGSSGSAINNFLDNIFEIFLLLDQSQIL